MKNSALSTALAPQMTRKSFLFIPGVGYKTERYLWRKGVTSWSQVKAGLQLPLIGSSKKSRIRDYIRKGQGALRRGDISFFAENLPDNEHWRLYKDFRFRTLFLDVETTGLSQYYDSVTLVGTFDGRESRIFVRDNNLADFKKLLNHYDILVTFNGKLFDVPFMKKEFPDLAFRHVHIDLRFLLRSVGIGGPLKDIEEKLGVHRSGEIADVSGREAAVLWGRFLKGDDDALRKLVLYNLSDTRNLKTLMDYCYVKKFRQDVLPLIRGSKFRRGGTKGTSRVFDGGFRPSASSPLRVIVKPEKESLHVLSNKGVLVKINRMVIQKRETSLPFLLERISARGKKPSVVGIDLSGSSKRPTGICVLSDNTSRLSTVYSDKELIERTIAASPSVVSIDSPLSLPKGRTCTRDNCRCRRFGITREIERILKKRGINVYPCLIRSMQNLTKRGMALSRVLKKKGQFVIESYPGAAQDILGFPRKRVNLSNLEVDLMNTGIVPLSENETVSHHELDALTSALVGYFYLADMHEAIGNKDEGYLIIPRLTQGPERHRVQAEVPPSPSLGQLP